MILIFPFLLIFYICFGIFMAFFNIVSFYDDYIKKMKRNGDEENNEPDYLPWLHK